MRGLVQFGSNLPWTLIVHITLALLQSEEQRRLPVLRREEAGRLSQLGDLQKGSVADSEHISTSHVIINMSCAVNTTASE